MKLSALRARAIIPASTGHPDRISFTVPMAALGKPRMTRRDKWARRPCVVEYRHWCDMLRAACPRVPEAASVYTLEVIATYAPPASWSKARRVAAIGMHKRTRPDGDNILKGVTDALWADDSAVGDQIVRRRYGERDQAEVILWMVDRPF